MARTAGDARRQARWLERRRTAGSSQEQAPGEDLGHYGGIDESSWPTTDELAHVTALAWGIGTPSNGFTQRLLPEPNYVAPELSSPQLGRARVAQPRASYSLHELKEV